jgi:hypothetical protein
MSSKIIIALLFSILISNMEAYQLNNDQTHKEILEENNELKNPYFIQRLQGLLAAIEGTNVENDNKDFSSLDHVINTRLVMNRRPGLLRLRKSD